MNQDSNTNNLPVNELTGVAPVESNSLNSTPVLVQSQNTEISKQALPIITEETAQPVIVRPEDVLGKDAPNFTSTPGPKSVLPTSPPPNLSAITVEMKNITEGDSPKSKIGEEINQQSNPVNVPISKEDINLNFTTTIQQAPLATPDITFNEDSRETEKQAPPVLSNKNDLVGISGSSLEQRSEGGKNFAENFFIVASFVLVLILILAGILLYLEYFKNYTLIKDLLGIDIGNIIIN